MHLFRQLFLASVMAVMLAGQAMCAGAEVPEGYVSSNVFEETFESGGAGWTLDGIWEVGEPTAGPGAAHDSTNCAATRLHANYTNDCSDLLVSPAINLPALPAAFSSIRLSFVGWLDAEAGIDLATLLVSTTGGADWIPLQQVPVTGQWSQVEIGLSAYAGQSILLGFRMASDESITRAGWYVDDICIDVLSPAPLAVNIASLNTLNFPFVYLNVNVTTNGDSITNLIQDNFTIYEDGIEQTSAYEVLPPGYGGGMRLSDIVFVMDNSGSMSDEQDQVEQNVSNFVANLESEGIDFALGLCRYGQADLNGDPIIEDNGVLTSDPDYFRDDVWQRNVADGGTEPGFWAIQDSCQRFNFRPGAQKVIIVITDESPDQGGATEQEAIDACFGGSATVFVLTDPTVSNEFDRIADETGGSIYNINTNFDAVLDEISAFLGSSYLISYESSDPDGTATERDVEVVVTYNSMSASNSASYIPRSAPKIERTEATLALHSNAWATGSVIQITARIVDHVEPFTQEAALYYKNTATQAFTYVAMNNIGGNLWQGTISNGYAEVPGVDYFIMATDGETTTSDPSVDPRANCYQLAILANWAPLIVHTPVTSPPTNAALTIQADVTDSTASLDSVRLYYRKTGQLLYQSVAMSNSVGNTYEADIPAGYVTSRGLDYYLKARDNQGVGRYHGTMDQPHQTLLPDIDVSPLLLTQGLYTGGRATQTVSIANTLAGQGPLVFEGVQGDSSHPGVISFSPLSGYLESPGSTSELQVVYDATGLTGGVYTVDFDIRSNDPDEPAVTVSASLTVTSACDIAASPAALDFGDIFLGTSGTQEVTVVNSGFAALNVTSVSSDNPDFTPGATSFSVAAGDSNMLALTCSPAGTGLSTGILSIACNDPDTPLQTLAFFANVLPPPVADISPTSIVETLASGGSTSVVITIDNSTGGSDLFFDISLSVPSTGPHPADSFGYSWLDSDDPGGPDFASYWQDISVIGTPSGLEGDDNEVTLPLPFNFPFYGKNEDSVVVSCNGYVMFDGWTTGYGEPLPSPSDPNAVIAPFWRDLEQGSGLHFYHYDSVRKCFIIQYSGWDQYGGGSTYDFQVQLFENGEICFAYLSMTGSVSGASIGVENHSGLVGLQMANGESYVRDELAVLISPQGSLGVDCFSARIPAGTSRDVTVLLDASDLPAGPYPGEVTVTCNDPLRTTTIIPVDLTVSGVPDIAFSENNSTTNLTPAYVGNVATASVVIVNTGTDVLTVSNVTSDNPDWVPGLTAFTLPRGQMRIIDVALTPPGVGPSLATLTVTSDDPDESPLVIGLRADCYLPPVMDIDASAITATLYNGQQDSRTLLLRNTGTGDLNFSVALQQPAVGYDFSDSDTAGGPAYEWNDISGIGTPTGLSGDDADVLLTLPFTFPFYGTSQTQVRAGSNGQLVFGADATSYSNQDLPDATTPNGLIAAFWDDLTSGFGSHHTYHDTARGRFVIQYTNWENLSGGSSYTFQIHLCENGEIYFYYNTMTGSLDWATIGIENMDGSEACQAAYAVAYVHSAMAVKFLPVTAFMSCDTAAGTVAAAGSTNIELTITASNLTEHLYTGQVLVTGNDPDNPSVAIPVTLYVEGVYGALSYSSWVSQYWPGGGSGGPDNDADGDGVSNSNEWLSCTDPTRVESVLHLSGVAPDPGSGGFCITWPSVEHRWYAIDWTASLTDGFSALVSNLPAVPPENVYTDTLHNAEATGFYRIRAYP